VKSRAGARLFVIVMSNIIFMSKPRYFLGNVEGPVDI